MKRRIKHYNVNRIMEIYYDIDMKNDKYNYVNLCSKNRGVCSAIDFNYFKECKYTSWYRNGVLCEIYDNYNNKKDGKYKTNYDNGDIEEKCNFINNKKDGELIYARA